MGLIGVTGATGGIGGRVVQRLAGSVPLRLIVRDAQRAPDAAGSELATADYADADAMSEASAGVDTLLLISASEHPDRIGLHRTAVDAAVSAGVRRIVYLSFLSAAPDATFTFARDHYWTEERIRSSGAEYTFLRDSLYADYVPFMASGGALRGPAGDGAVALVTRDDVADVAAAVLTAEGHSGETYDVTGPELVTFAQMAQTLSRVTGRDVTYENETMDQARASRESYGAPEWELQGWITSYAAVSTGEMAVGTDVVERVTGHPPQSLEQFLVAHPDSYRHLTSG